MPTILRKVIPTFGDVLFSPAQWEKFSVAESAFTAAASSEDVELFSLPAGEIIHAVKIKHSTSWTGGGATDALLSVGISGNLEKYASLFSVFQAVANDTLQLSDSFGTENHGAATSIRVQLFTLGADVADLTAGAADIWVLKGPAVV